MAQQLAKTIMATLSQPTLLPHYRYSLYSANSIILVIDVRYCDSFQLYLVQIFDCLRVMCEVWSMTLKLEFVMKN